MKSAAFWDRRVGGLVSLYELMREFHPALCSDVFAAVARLEHLLSAERPEKAPSAELMENARTFVVMPIRILCKEASLVESLEMLERLDGRWRRPVTCGQFRQSLEEFRGLLSSELKKRVMLILESGRQVYFDHGCLFGQRTHDAFPSARGDIQEAGNCYAAGRYTASVFHAMRALEPALRAMADDLGAPCGVEVWHTIIESIESKIRDAAKSLPCGSDKSERLQFLSEAAKEFTYFKDGWRNYVAHGRSVYDAEQALSAINHVKAFMTSLARQLHE